MDSKDVQEWVKTVGVLGVLVTAGVAIFQYKVNSQAEERMREASQAEIDIRLSTAFTELMRVAIGRSTQQLSEKCVEKLFAHGISQEDSQQLKDFVSKNWGDDTNINRKLVSCVISFPVGEPSTSAAITSVAVLGNKYDILREPAREGLESLKKYAGPGDNVAQRALLRLEAGTSAQQSNHRPE